MGSPKPQIISQEKLPVLHCPRDQYGVHETILTTCCCDITWGSLRPTSPRKDIVPEGDRVRRRLHEGQGSHTTDQSPSLDVPSAPIWAGIAGMTTRPSVLPEEVGVATIVDPLQRSAADERCRPALATGHRRPLARSAQAECRAV